MNIGNCVKDMTWAVKEGGRLAFDMRKSARVLSERVAQMGAFAKRVVGVDVGFLVQRRILAILRERNSICGVLSREKDEESALLEADFNHRGGFRDGQYTLMVNPIDGKKNYTEPGHPYASNYGTCVHLAEGREVIAGAMYLPELDAMITTLIGGGTFINGERVRIKKNTDFSFDNPVRVHTLGDAIEGLFPNNPYPRAASAVLLTLLRGEIKSYLVGGVAVINFGSAQTAYEEAGGVVRDFDGQPMRSSDLMAETGEGLILQGFIGMAPSDEYFRKMMTAIKLKSSESAH